MSIETKRGYKITLQGKDIIITCPSVIEAIEVFESLKVNILLGKLRKMGEVKKVEPYRI